MKVVQLLIFQVEKCKIAHTNNNNNNNKTTTPTDILLAAVLDSWNRQL
jgi:hypothetical protein